MLTLLWLAASEGLPVAAYDDGVVVGGVLFASVDEAVMVLAGGREVEGEA